MTNKTVVIILLLLALGLLFVFPGFIWGEPLWQHQFVAKADGGTETPTPPPPSDPLVATLVAQNNAQATQIAELMARGPATPTPVVTGCLNYVQAGVTYHLQFGQTQQIPGGTLSCTTEQGNVFVPDSSVDLGVQPSPTFVPTGPAPACRDGELVLVHAADNDGNKLERLPIGEAERVDILELSWPGSGFGGLDRAIVVIPRLGPVWQVNIKSGSQTIATRGFCGDNNAVANWAVQSHIPSLQQASRDSGGNQPPANEIAVYILNFEEKSMRVVSPASAANAPTPEEVLGWLEVTFHEGGNQSAVPISVFR